MTHHTKTTQYCTYLKGNGDNDHRHEEGVLVHALEHVPLVENRPGVQLVKDLAENERVEQNAARPIKQERQGGAEGGGEGGVSEEKRWENKTKKPDHATNQPRLDI